MGNLERVMTKPKRWQIHILHTEVCRVLKKLYMERHVSKELEDMIEELYERIFLMDRFYNRNGTLNGYAFGCGYVEAYTTPQDTIRISKDGCWHVKHEGFWETFESVHEARKCVIDKIGLKAYNSINRSRMVRDVSRNLRNNSLE